MWALEAPSLFFFQQLITVVLWTRVSRVVFRASFSSRFESQESFFLSISSRTQESLYVVCPFVLEDFSYKTFTVCFRCSIWASWYPLEAKVERFLIGNFRVNIVFSQSFKLRNISKCTQWSRILNSRRWTDRSQKFRATSMTEEAVYSWGIDN